MILAFILAIVMLFCTVLFFLLDQKETKSRLHILRYSIKGLR